MSVFSGSPAGEPVVAAPPQAVSRMANVAASTATRRMGDPRDARDKTITSESSARAGLAIVDTKKARAEARALSVTSKVA
jgi:hypothetical protein